MPNSPSTPVPATLEPTASEFGTPNCTAGATFRLPNGTVCLPCRTSCPPGSHMWGGCTLVLDAICVDNDIDIDDENGATTVPTAQEAVTAAPQETSAPPTAPGSVPTILVRFNADLSTLAAAARAATRLRILDDVEARAAMLFPQVVDDPTGFAPGTVVVTLHAELIGLRVAVSFLSGSRITYSTADAIASDIVDRGIQFRVSTAGFTVVLSTTGASVYTLPHVPADTAATAADPATAATITTSPTVTSSAEDIDDADSNRAASVADSDAGVAAGVIVLIVLLIFVLLAGALLMMNRREQSNKNVLNSLKTERAMAATSNPSFVRRSAPPSNLAAAGQMPESKLDGHSNPTYGVATDETMDLNAGYLSVEGNDETVGGTAERACGEDAYTAGTCGGDACRDLVPQPVTYAIPYEGAAGAIVDTIGLYGEQSQITVPSGASDAGSMVIYNTVERPPLGANRMYVSGRRRIRGFHVARQQFCGEPCLKPHYYDRFNTRKQ